MNPASLTANVSGSDESQDKQLCRAGSKIRQKKEKKRKGGLGAEMGGEKGTRFGKRDIWRVD